MICSIEYQKADGTWWVGHHAIDLRDPERYERLVNQRQPARVRPAIPCTVCGEFHPDGVCLL